MGALILWLEWRKRMTAEPNRMPGGDTFVTLGLTGAPVVPVRCPWPAVLLRCVD